MKPNLHRRLFFLLLICFFFEGIFSQNTFAQTCSQNQAWFWPVPNSKSMSRGTYYISSSNYHNGIDITGGTGQKIVAAADGIVIAVFDGCKVSPGAYVYNDIIYAHDHSKCSPVAQYLNIGTKPGLKSSEGYCNYGVGKGVFVDHGNGVWSRYQHMDTVNVSVGQCVTGGVTQLGTMGAYGYATGSHLHFEIMTGSTFTNGGYWNGTSLNNQPCGSGYTRGYWNNVCGITYNHNYTPVGTLSIKGILDGKEIGNITGYGTVKVYINGTQESNYNKQYEAGTKYRVVFTPKDGYAVDGESTYEGSIVANNASVVQFTINSVWLKVTGVLDGQPSDSLNGYGTFDVISTDQYGSNPVVVANDVSSFNQRMKAGSTFEITDIKANDGFTYKGLTTGEYSYTGRFMQGGTTTVTLAFDSIPVEPSCEWNERPFIPSNVNANTWEIEVKNHYSQVSTTSPGSGWTQTGSSTRYVISGEPYTTYRDLGETATRKFVEYVWYHWCGYSGHSDWVELDSLPGYWKYCENPYDNSTLEDRKQYEDSNFSTTQVYQHELWWKAGPYAGHLAHCGLGGQRWYFGWKYQDYTAVTENTYVRDSDWLSLDQLDPNATSVSYRFRLKNCEPVSYTVTFKVVNGSWDDGTTADKTVTLEGIESDSLTLTAAQIPVVGSKPNTNYKAGSWGVTPNTTTPITADTIYTYTYVKKKTISAQLTFKVVNGSWNDGRKSIQQFYVKGYEGDTLKLQASDALKIPSVGQKPDENYKAGSWSPEIKAYMDILGDTTFTYTYVPKSAITRTVTFKVVNGFWDDGTTANKTVTLNGYEGDTLSLTTEQIPAVGSKPNETYKAGSWDATPDTATAITANMTYTYTYDEDESDARVKLTLSSERARSGEEVTVGVNIENNPGIAQMLLSIVYDNTKLSFIESIDSGLTGWSLGADTISWEANQDSDYNGEIVKLKFQVSETAEEGDVIVSVVCEDGDMFSFEETPYVPVIQSGKVNIYKNTPGDITGDGRVNSQDLLRLRRYLLKLNVEIVGNADVTGDGRVNSQDLLRLRRYLLKLPVELY